MENAKNVIFHYWKNVKNTTSARLCLLLTARPPGTAPQWSAGSEKQAGNGRIDFKEGIR